MKIYTLRKISPSQNHVIERAAVRPMDSKEPGRGELKADWILSNDEMRSVFPMGRNMTTTIF
jgi:hypothetical protein